MKKLNQKLLCLYIILVALPLHAQTKASLSALHAAPAKEGMYKLTFSLAQDLAAKSEVIIDFPGQFDLSAIKIAGSNEINGGIQFDTDQNKLTLKRSGLGSTVPAGKKVSIIFGPLKNPDELKNDLFVQISFNAKGPGIGAIREKVKFE